MAAPLVITMHPADNVAVVVPDGGLPAGTALAPAFAGGTGVTLTEHVPQAHKVALRDIAKGAGIRRYDVVIGHARDDIAAGSWVHEHRMTLPAPRSLDDLVPAYAGMATQSMRRPGESRGASPDGYTFEGYRNPDGSVGTRNLLAISTTVQCVSGVVDHAVKRIRNELLPRYPNVDDVVALEHTYGCGVAIDATDAAIPIRTLRNIALNPNFGNEVMVVSLGCEKLQPARLMPRGSLPVVDDTPDTVVLQDARHVGFMSMIESIMTTAETHLARLNARRRETCPASDLVVGVQCGGSDAFSGITANPALGHAADLLVRAGATVMFSETTEVRDGVAELTARAATRDVADAIVREMAWYDDYLMRTGGVDRSANTTPGNKAGGLSNIVEKAMGSIVKSGSSPIVGVLSPGERLRDRGVAPGLVFCATPASDFICGTLQLAAGMNVHVFTTGRGTPYGLAECPVIKVATRSDLARRWHDLMDVDAGRIVDGEADVESLGRELFREILDVASGKRTWAERWGIRNALTVFNPAPVT